MDEDGDIENENDSDQIFEFNYNYEWNKYQKMKIDKCMNTKKTKGKCDLFLIN